MSLSVDSKKDFTAEVQTAKAESVQIADSKGIDEAIVYLLGLEKKCRTNNDFHNLKEICLHMVRLCHDRKDWAKLNSTLVVINKRRAQNKLAVTAIVHEALTYVDETPSEAEKIALIRTLMDICEGKIYVEAESARLHLMLAFIYENKGNIGDACDIIQDVHVETYGSIPREEKAEYIFHQTRLNILNKDYVRALIQSRKMNRKTLEEATFQDVKVKFYRLMTEYYSHEKDCWEVSQCYYKICDTPIIRDDKIEFEQALKNSIAFLILAKHDNHRSDMMHRLHQQKEVQQISAFSKVLDMFTTTEVIAFPFEFQPEIEAAIKQSLPLPSQAEEFIKLLHTRVTEHNIRVLRSYYSRIGSSRMAQMLGLTVDALEDHLSEMSANGDISVKIDRPVGIVVFSESSTAEEVMSDWASSVSSMLSLMESTCHLINRENMVNRL
mmetsp:Transcript_16903/g.25477  ORF Transcript_16903/g.25477 Transcript_16903/m.25477 type:complete len:439 (-) Transcript_16903:192-1508(-)